MDKTGDAWAKKGLAAHKSNQLENAVKFYLEAIKQGCSFKTAVHTNLGVIYKQLGNFDEAAKHYNEAVKGEQNANLYANLSSLIRMEISIKRYKVRARDTRKQGMKPVHAISQSHSTKSETMFKLSNS